MVERINDIRPNRAERCQICQNMTHLANQCPMRVRDVCDRCGLSECVCLLTKHRHVTFDPNLETRRVRMTQTICQLCDEVGTHQALECPLYKREPMLICQLCSAVNSHSAKNFYKMRPAPKEGPQDAAETRAKLVCSKCERRGHTSATCNLNRIVCNYCSKIGHRIMECKKRKYDMEKKESENRASIKHTRVIGKDTIDYDTDDDTGPFTVYMVNLGRKNIPQPSITISDDRGVRDITLMVDSGSEINLVRQRALDSSIAINVGHRIALKGIARTPVVSLGTVNLRIMSHNVRFHVVADEVDVPHDGILGHEFLVQTGAVVDYRHQEIRIGEAPIPRKGLIYKVDQKEASAEKLKGLFDDELERDSKFFDRQREEARRRDEYVPTITKPSHYLSEKDIFQGEEFFPGDDIFEGENEFRNYRKINHIVEKYEILGEIRKNEELREVYSEDLEEYFTYPLRVTATETVRADKIKARAMENIGLDLPDEPKERIVDSEKRTEYIFKNMKTEHLETEKEIAYVREMVSLANDRFYIEGDEFEGINHYHHRIQLQDDYPVRVKGYRLPHNLRAIVDKEIDKFLKNDIIQHS